MLSPVHGGLNDEPCAGSSRTVPRRETSRGQKAEANGKAQTTVQTREIGEGFLTPFQREQIETRQKAREEGREAETSRCQDDQAQGVIEVSEHVQAESAIQIQARGGGQESCPPL